MSDNDETDIDERSPVDMAMDVFVFAPLGATIEMWERMPELAKVGRDRFAAQAPGARMVGQFAVRTGRSKLEETVRDLARTGYSALEQAGLVGGRGDTESTDEAPADSPGAADDPSAQDLPIDEYDEMTAASIVPVLASLDRAERELVRAHEAATRGRRTILAKLDQLDAAAN